MSFNDVLKIRIPGTLRERLDDAAHRSARTRSDLAREAVMIGLQSLARRIPDNSSSPSKAA